MINPGILYLADLDGTVLNTNAELSDYSEKTLNAMLADGLQFSIASARTAYSAQQILSRLNLSLPVILQNGVLIYDVPAGRFINVEYLAPETSERIVSVMRKYELGGFMYLIENDVQKVYYTEPETPALRQFREIRKNRYGKKFCLSERFEDEVSDKVNYFALLDTYEKLNPVNNELFEIPGVQTAFYHDVYTDGLWLLEAFSRKASKHNAALKLKMLGCYDKIVGFGDGLNDLSLFEACDECYAVANAADELKAAATAVIESNVDDGVVRYLEAMIYKK